MEPTWGAWSAWLWDPAQGRMFRARQDTEGNYDYEYPPADPRASLQAEQPRGDGMDELTNQVNNVNLGGHPHPSYSMDNAYTTYSSPGIAGGTATGAYNVPLAQTQHAGSAKGKGKGRESRGRGNKDYRDRDRDQREAPRAPKGQRPRPTQTYHDGYEATPAAQYAGQDPFYKRSGTASASVSSSAYAPAYVSDHQSAFPGQQEDAEPVYGASPRGSAYASGLSHSPDVDQHYGRVASPAHTDAHPGDRNEEPELADEGHRVHRSHASDPGVIAPEDSPADEQGPSYHHSPPAALAALAAQSVDAPDDDLHGSYSQAGAYMTGDIDPSYSPGVPSSVATTSHYATYSAYGLDSAGRETPRPTDGQSDLQDDYQYQTHPTAGASHKRDIDDFNRYRVAHSSEFEPGKILKILWSEPRGAGSRRSEVPTQRKTFFEDSGQAVYQGIRRFIVVANDEGHCTVVPVLTYERQGCNKRGVKPLKHGIIHQMGKLPQKLPREPDMGFQPVRAILDERAEFLVKESRVNYAKLQTVEHNIPVFFIGRVHPRDFDRIVTPAVEYCWERKRRTAY